MIGLWSVKNKYTNIFFYANFFMCFKFFIGWKNIINFLVNKLKGGKPLFGKVKLRKDEILKIYPDISKANKILKWRPKINFTKGLINTIKHYKNN